MMNPALGRLHPYPFEKLAALFADLTPPSDLPNISLSIGEPKHAAPEFVKQALIDSLQHLSTYPTTKGLLSLRQAIATWLTNRFGLQGVNPETQVIPVSGTREALFSFVQAAVDRDLSPKVVMPNPFYQIYEGAAILAGATPYLVNCTADNDYLGDWERIPNTVWAQTQLVFVCTPGNPTGAVMPADKLKRLIELSDEYGFTIASDECYSELYFDQAPIGLLEVCAQMGRHDFKNCVVFHSLSKRSNLPGLRSGFVAGDARLLGRYLQYRTYHGAALPVQHQLASVVAWQDEAHVEANRVLYRQKFDLFLSELGDRLPLKKPDAGFYFWLPVDNDERFARQLYSEANITVLAGRYLSRETQDGNPGANHVRMALVADIAQCEQAIERIKRVIGK
jgi:N-succinyldiaminopimelate aminotransferase